MSFPFTDDQLIEMAKKYGARDARHGADGLTGLDEDTLRDVADDGWYHSGWMEFENHPDLDDHMDELSKKSTALKLSGHYADAFVAQALSD